MTVTALTIRYARAHGLASSFLTGPAAAGTGGASGTNSGWIVPSAIGTVLAFGLALADDTQSVIAVVWAALAAAAVALLARRRIGGFTGDTLGAGGVVAETIGLLAAVAVLRP
jgi:adenosylcobinamide-GDP ribazoletransferase